MAAALVLIVVGVVVVATNVGSIRQKISSQTAPLPAATLQLPGVHHGQAKYAKPLHVRVTNGVLQSVKIHGAGQKHLAGAFNKTRTRWHSAAPLAPSSHLKAAISYVDLAHHVVVRHTTIRTAAAKQHFNSFLSPGGGTVGIGSPVSVSFDRAIPANRQAAVERGLTVTSKPAVIGAWHWMSDQSVHWRPPEYWKPGTKVRVTSNLQGVSIGKGIYGQVGSHSTSFTIGAAHISEANQATHQMKVYDNGRLVRTFPISTGRTQYPTMDGVHIALEKSPVVQMDSATVGIPKGSPGYYNETVYWDVRISNGGEFVHAAPWSVGSQGFTNVSHGCVNISTTNAEWFYHWSFNGDIVDVYDGVRPPETGDAGTADWNMSWKQWLAGDAAPTKAAKALHPRMPRDGEPGFGPAPKSTKHHHKSHHSKRSHHSKKSHHSNSSGSSSSW
jgi:lipoprotein-anchoring transpeptidase ErfK/SrfK